MKSLLGWLPMLAWYSVALQWMEWWQALSLGVAAGATEDLRKYLRRNQ